ncbi:uncharacterized protein LOC132284501 isoform X2 [Cornus florida]|uniref:uncharacterized protein LOC132284501 isoform X2 n=1 Tax=Cornus florida TaxID=4283 RepID=UPI0028963873|nr:uncharacterized protein LOC132284501 isoform X2 [Cornus florida]
MLRPSPKTVPTTFSSKALQHTRVQYASWRLTYWTKLPFSYLRLTGTCSRSEIARKRALYLYGVCVCVRERERGEMFGSLKKLQVSNPAITASCDRNFARNFDSCCRLNLRLPPRRFASVSLQSDNASSEPSISSFTATVGSSSPSSLQLSQWTLTHRHIQMLNVIACAAAVSATWLFCSAIPTLLAFKRAAESMEKLWDVTREELPDTMAAVRLSGMEISDLTMELSDLGQEITQGVKSSTRAVRLAEERLRRLTNMAPSGRNHGEN